MTTARGASSVSSAWLCGRHAFLCCVARGACAVSCPWNCVCGACGPFSCGVFEQTWSPHHRVRGLPAPQGPSLCHSCSYAYLHEKPRHSLSRVQLHEPLHCSTCSALTARYGQYSLQNRRDTDATPVYANVVNATIIHFIASQPRPQGRGVLKDSTVLSAVPLHCDDIAARPHGCCLSLA